MDDRTEVLVARPSPGQQALWLHDQVAGNPAAHHVSAVVDVDGPLDVDALGVALQTVAARHEALRTAFRLEGDALVQVVLGDAHPPLTVDAVADDLAAQVEGLLAAPFDLELGRPWRVHLLRRSATSHVIVLVAHHIAVDAVSTRILLEELTSLYDAATRGETIELPDLPIQYADHAEWRRDQWDAGLADALTGRWRDRLTGVAPLDPTPLPPGPRPVAGLTRTWGPELAAALDRVARATASTPFTVVLACHSAVLGHRHDRDEVTTLTPVDGRDTPEVERVVGYFIGVVPIRVRVYAAGTWAELLRTAQTAALDAFADPGLSPEATVDIAREVGAAGAGRIGSQTLLVLQERRPATWSAGGVRLRLHPTPGLEAKADLVLDLRPVDDTVVAEFEYDTRLLTAAQVERFADDLERAVVACATTPDSPVSDALPDRADRGSWRRDTAPVVVTAGTAADPPTVADTTRPEIDPTLSGTAREVAELWSELLPGGPVTETANFFELGGKSLSAVLLAARLRERYAIELSVAADLYRDFTLGGVAAVVDARRGRATPPPAPAPPPATTIEHAPRVDHLTTAPASLAQEAMWERLRPDRVPPVVLGGLRVEGPLDPGRLVDAFGALAVRHASLRSGFRMEGGALIQVVHDRAALPVTFLSVDSEADFPEVVRDQLATGFDLDRGPLARLVVLRVASDLNILFLMMHHLVADGRSVEIVLRDTVVGYQGTAADLPAVPVPFSEFARQHRERLAAGRERDAVAHWTGRLHGAQPVGLPTDLLPVVGGDAPGDSVEQPLSPTTVERLTTVASELRTTPNVVGASAFLVLLAEVSGQRDVCVRTPVTYRDDASAQDVVADFSNDLVLRTDLGGDPTWREVVATVRDRLAADLVFHDLPPERLAPHLPDPTLLDRLFQVQFTSEDEIPPPDLGTGLTATTVTPRFPYAYRALSVRLRLGCRPHLVWIHRVDLFSPARIATLTQRFAEILDAALTDLDRRAFPEPERVPPT